MILLELILYELGQEQYMKNVLGQWIRIQYEYIYVKKSPGIQNVFIPARMELKKKTNKKHKHTKKELFSYQSIFSFFGGCPKFPFFDNLARKARTQKKL